MKKTIISICLLLLTSNIIFAQEEVKIGYTSVEQILPYMPEAQVANKQLEEYQKKKAEQYQNKENKLKLDIQKLQEAIQNGLSEEEAKTREQALQKQQQELQEFAQQVQFDIQAKEMELLRPILEKLQNSIDEIAEEEGYAYVLNQTTSTGVSTILYGPEEHDITMKLIKKLGIELPEGNIEEGE